MYFPRHLLLSFILFVSMTRSSSIWDPEENDVTWSSDLEENDGISLTDDEYYPIRDPSDDDMIYTLDGQDEDYLSGSIQQDGWDDSSSDLAANKQKGSQSSRKDTKKDDDRPKKCRIRIKGIGKQVIESLESKWSLQLPISGKNAPGSMFTISPSDVKSFERKGIFETTKTALVMTVDVDKVRKIGPGKSPNSKYYRTEFRQGTDSYPGFSLGGASQSTLEITFSVDQLVNSPNGVVIAQIHGPGPLPNMELKVKSDGSIIPENHKNAIGVDVSGNPKKLTTGYKIGTKATVKIVAGRGLIQFWYNGVLNNAVTIDGTYTGQYWKFGTYCQSTMPGAVCQVSFYSVNFSAL